MSDKHHMTDIKLTKLFRVRGKQKLKKNSNWKRKWLRETMFHKKFDNIYHYLLGYLDSFLSLLFLDKESVKHEETH